MHAKMCHLPGFEGFVQSDAIQLMQQLNIDQKHSNPNNAQCNRAELCTNTMSVLLNCLSFAFCFLSRVTYASSFAINHAVALFTISFAWGKYPSVTAPTFAKSAYTISP